MRAKDKSWKAKAFIGLALMLTQGARAQAPGTIAQLMKVMPTCALECVLPLMNITDQMASSMTICDSRDPECPCSSKDSLSTAQACIGQKCTVLETLKALNVTTTACGLPIRNSSYKLNAVAIVFSVLSGLFVIQRFAVKIFSTDLLLGLDDWMTLLAALTQAGLSGIAVAAGAANGLGKDIWTLTPEQITNFFYYLYVWSTIYFVNIAMCKLAFLLFFLRVFPAPKVRSILWATVGFVVAYGVMFFFVNTFQCIPIHHYWQRWEGEGTGKCWNASVIAWTNAAINITLDLWIICIPLRELRRLNLDWKKKLGVGLMFCVGLLSTVISSIRLDLLVKHNWQSENQSYVKLDIAVWSIIEINVGIICACLPAFRILLVRVFPCMSFGRAHKDNSKEDFHDGDRELGFGTISRSVAGGKHGRHLPIIPGAIAMSREYKVEHTINPTTSHGVALPAARKFVYMPYLNEYDGETLDGRSSFDMRSLRRGSSGDGTLQRGDSGNEGVETGEPSDRKTSVDSTSSIKNLK